jgi:hypothetical protein
VRNKNRVHPADVDAVRFKPPLGRNAADPGVEEQLLPRRLDVDAVAVGARLKRDHFHHMDCIRPAALLEGKTALISESVDQLIG